MKVSIIGSYCVNELGRAFGELGWTVFQHPEDMVVRDCLGRPKISATLKKANLYVLVGEHGDARKLPRWAHPLVTWAIDPHYPPGLKWSLSNAKVADLAFVSEKRTVTDFAQRGMKARWLPLACGDEPRRITTNEDCDLTFVGNLGTDDRIRICELVRKRFPNSYIGTAWGEELTQLYGRSRIVLNSSWMTTYRNIPPRVFHVLTAGKCLLTDECFGLLDLFKEDKHLVVYRSDEELVAKATGLLEDPERRNRIAAAGHAKAMKDHTFKNRVQKILEECKKNGIFSN